MQTSPNTSDTSRSPRWHDRIWAAFIFFTRLPLWRLHQPPREAYRTVVEHWPLAGWLTGGTTAATLWVACHWMAYPLAVLAAIVVRLLLTGALHEDGLADFIDGFGGGSDRQRTLAIMKDSHIGTYGVLGLILYELTLWSTLCAMPVALATTAIMAADPYAKMLTGPIVTLMPYARREEEAKAQIVYRPFQFRAYCGLLLQGLLPALPLLHLLLTTAACWWLFFLLPVLTAIVLYIYVWRRLHAYTGDCCGAICLLTELTALLTLSAL